MEIPDQSKYQCVFVLHVKVIYENPCLTLNTITTACPPLQQSTITAQERALLADVGPFVLLLNAKWGRLSTLSSHSLAQCLTFAVHAAEVAGCALSVLLFCIFKRALVMFAPAYQLTDVLFDFHWAH